MDKVDIELRKHKFISFVTDHYNPVGVIRSLGEKDIFPIVILIAKDPCMVNHSKYISKIHRVDSVEEGYNILLDVYGNETYKPFVFCSDDKNEGFLDRHYDEIKDKFFFYNAGEQGRITWLQNKDNITNLGAEAGLDCPKKEVVEKGILPKTLKYPIITKVLMSAIGGGKSDSFICQNENEVIEAYKRIKSPKLILQEYIERTGEFCMEGFSIADGKEICMPYMADYIRFYDKRYGDFMDMIPFNDEILRQKIEKLFKLTRYNGIFEIEFMKGPDGKQYFLEINFRASTWNYAPTVGGCNMPYLWAKSMLLGKIPYDEFTLRDKPFRAMVEPSDFLRNVRKVGLLQWIKDWKSTECYYYYNSKDPMPFWYYLRKKILKF